MHLGKIIAIAGWFLAMGAAPAGADVLEGKKPPGEILAGAADDDWRAIPASELIVLTLERGQVLIALAPEIAPRHAANFVSLANAGFYDGLSFYRVIDGFVAQGGDVFEEREGGPSALRAEFDVPYNDGTEFASLKDHDGYAAQPGFHKGLPAGTDENQERIWLLHCTGALAMAREPGRDTASAEFYITLQPQRYLDRNLTVFGRVIRGMEHIQALRRVSPPESKDDDRGDRIVTIRSANKVQDASAYDIEMLRTDTPLFQDFVEARRNRPEAFFYHRPDFADICAIPVPVRERRRESE